MTNQSSSDQPKRRTISPAQKLEYLAGYDQAIQTQEGAAFLRFHGLYSSQIAEWRKQRDAGILEGMWRDRLNCTDRDTRFARSQMIRCQRFS